MVIQLLGVLVLVFTLVRLTPGDPAVILAGPYPTPEVVSAIRKQLGLDNPWPVQLWDYVLQALHGNLGISLSSGRPVTQDLLTRLPATLELITATTIVCVAGGVSLGMFLARRKTRVGSRVVFGYSMLAGAIPDFWIGLLFVFAFSTSLAIAPAPLGQLGLNQPPPHKTGFYLLDALIAGQLSTLVIALWYLLLPVATLVFANMGQFVKMTRLSIEEADASPFVQLYDGAGVDPRVTKRRSLRLALRPIITLSAVLYGFLLGGAVLVEKVFSWGGAGQYAVDAVGRSDYAGLEGFVLVAATFNILVYLAADVILMIADPRIGRTQ
jgi:ABC-type dipeptide/oligopeptide/nickel transport system permease component